MDKTHPKKVGFLLLVFECDLEPWRLPLEKGEVRFLYTDVEFY